MNLHESQLPSGATYCTGPNGEQICTGSQMGRRNILPDDCTQPCKLSMIRLGWHSGDYDAGGAYWGHTPGEFIYWARGDCGEVNAQVFVRARTRQGAKALVRDILPGATFYR